MMSTIRVLGCFMKTLAVGVAVGLHSLTVARAAGPPDTERDASLIAQ